MSALIQVVLTALGIVFIHATTWDGMIFSRVRVALWGLPLWIKKPLFMCPICMTSIWGTALYFQPFEFITYLFAVGGMMTLLSFILPDR
jgi:hypothetical protein